MAKGMEVVQGSFYRKQPECIEYRFGLSAEKNVVIITVLWSSKEDFNACPSDPNDLKRINEARAPLMKMLNGPKEEAMSM